MSVLHLHESRWMRPGLLAVSLCPGIRELSALPSLKRPMTLQVLSDVSEVFLGLHVEMVASNHRDCSNSDLSLRWKFIHGGVTEQDL